MLDNSYGRRSGICALGRRGIAYFGLHLTEALRVTNGATMVDAEGRVGGGAISGEVSDWVDCSGTVAAGRRAGAARKGYTLKRGDVLES